MIHILLVDEHKIFLIGTKTILEERGMRVTSCTSGQEALEHIQNQEFDLYLYDSKSIEFNGVSLSDTTLSRYPNARIIVFSGTDLSLHFNSLLQSGVCGMLEKNASEEELLTHIEMALQNKAILPLPLLKKLKSMRLEDPGQIPILTDKDIDILKQAARGKKNKEIADLLFMSQRNVEYHFSQIFNKFKVSSRGEAVQRAKQLQLF